MNITCYDIDGNLLKTLTQWDINQKIVINNLSLTNTPEVHFCNPHSELALVGESTYSDGTLTTEVPNILLQENLPIIVYIYVPKGDGSAKTTYSIRIPVNPRPKPADYEYSDNAHFITYEELQAALANSVEVIELANAAADRANEAASVAETSLEYGKNNFANAVKGNKSGKVVCIDDISPVTHKVSVKVKSKNLIGSFIADKEVIRDGVTMSVEQGGQTITLNGVCGTAGGGRNLFLSVATPFILEKGKAYTLFHQIISGTTDGIYTLYISACNNNAAIVNCSNTQGKTTFTAEDTVKCYIGVNLNANTTYNNVVICFQLEEGSTATEYEPYIDLSTVNVTACGKNLIPFGQNAYVAGQSKTINGVTFTVNDDGSVTANGTATAGASFQLKPLNIGKEYCNGTQIVTLSGCPEGGSATTYCMRVKSGADADSNYDEYGTGKTITNYDLTGSTINCIVFGGATVENITFYPMLEFGETASEYEVYCGNTVTANADGTVEGLYSINPYMCVYADNSYISVECTYNCDTAKIIEKSKADIEVKLNGVKEDIEKRGYRLINTTIFEEDAERVLFSIDAEGNSLKNLNLTKMFILFTGSFTNTTPSQPLCVLFNNGGAYQMYKTFNITADNFCGLWFESEKIISFTDRTVYKSTYPSTLLGNFNADTGLAQGLSANNVAVISDLSVVKFADISKIGFGCFNSNNLIKTGSTVYLFGV